MMNKIILIKNIILIYAILLPVLYSSAILENENRVHEHKLSEEEHYIDGKHNPNYDHDAFLSAEGAQEFKGLSQEERLERLGKIVDKIDLDHDGFVSLDELRGWINNATKRYIMKDVESRWAVYDPNNTESFTLERMLDVNYGSLGLWTEEEKETKKDIFEQYQRIRERDEKRFAVADDDKDGKLTKAEYGNFLHPEEEPHMRNLVIEETIEDMDKNKDGYIDVEEYIKNIFPDNRPEDKALIETERGHFATYRDDNQDGKLDKDEVTKWLFPPEYDQAEAEARHLIYSADTNQDEKLSKEEILENPGVFVSGDEHPRNSFDNAIKEDL